MPKGERLDRYITQTAHLRASKGLNLSTLLLERPFNDLRSNSLPLPRSIPTPVSTSAFATTSFPISVRQGSHQIQKRARTGVWCMRS